MTRALEPGTLFRFATAGSVDDGKSTLVGRLLHDSKAILADQLEQVARTSAERGFAHGEFDFALLTDGLRAEREQGITIDVAYRYFSTGARSFILADCPGHVQYTRNMVTGATTADAVVVLIDGRKGVLEQTRRHLAVIALLRVPHVIVAVNKIDLLGYAEDAFTPVEEQVRAVTAELGIPGVHVLPVSALEGDNIVERSARMPWYDGPALLELLEQLPAADELVTEFEPFRLPVQLVLRPQGGLAPGASPPIPTARSATATTARSRAASRPARSGWATPSRCSRAASRPRSPASRSRAPRRPRPTRRSPSRSSSPPTSTLPAAPSSRPAERFRPAPARSRPSCSSSMRVPSGPARACS